MGRNPQMPSNPEDQARERIEQMQGLNSGMKVIKNSMGVAVMGPTDELVDLKRKYEKLKTIVINALVSIDILLKFGIPVVLFFWPIPQDQWIQAIGLAGFVALLTIISKTITKVRTQE